MNNYIGYIDFAHESPQQQELQEQMEPPMVITKMFVVFCHSDMTRSTGWRKWKKKFILWMSEGLGHVEFVFQRPDNTCFACSNTVDRPICFEERDPANHYDMSRWVAYAVNFSPQEMQGIYRFCRAQVGKTYNHRGVNFNFFPVLRWFCGTSEDDTTTWFCSQLVMAALKQVRPRMFGQYNPAQTNIAQLHRLLDQNDCFTRDMIVVMGDPSRYDLKWGVV